MTHVHLLERMQTRIDAWEQDGDRRVIFLACYALMTRNMLNGLEAGRFHDTVWVHRLVHHFAEYYFVALDAYEQGEANRLPDVWRQAHDLTREPHIPAILHLLMGVNAHINCDLVLALDDMLRDEWSMLTPAQGKTRLHDHLMVNTIIGETIDTVQDTVLERYSPAMELVDSTFGALDEWLTAKLIRNWRADVWRRASAIIIVEDPLQRAELRRNADSYARERMRLALEGGALGARVFGYSQRWLNRLNLG